VNEWYVGVPVALLALAVLVLAVALARLRRRVAALESAPPAEKAAPPESPVAEVGEPAYVVTGVVSTGSATEVGSAAEETADDRRIDGSLFADLVLRESVVKGVSFAHGVRRALAPESRHRIRFLMRQEVKRSRRQRKADLRAARRLLADRHRVSTEDAA
jgi:hypothetical protein